MHMFIGKAKGRGGERERKCGEEKERERGSRR